MARLADGDRAAFDPVFEAVWPVLQDFTHSVLRHTPDAEDAAQQALIRAFERASGYDPGREALPWILGIAWNECRSVRRRLARRREESLVTASTASATATDPEVALVNADLQRAVREVLGSLGASDIEAILADLGDVPRPRLSPTTFRKRLERARRRLRQVWEERHGVH